MTNIPLNPNKMTSVEAAAMILSGGRTRDVELANHMANGFDMDMDGLARAGLRRSMGFDFGLKIRPGVPYILVLSREKPYVHTKCKLFEGDLDEYGSITNEETIKRLVAACVRLKEKREALIERDEKNLIDMEED